MTESVPQNLRHWLHRHGLPEQGVEPGKALAVVFDRVRVTLHVRPGGLLLETQLGALPAAQAARDAILERALRTSASRARNNPATVTVDDAAAALWLQRWVPDNLSDDRFDDIVGALVNETEHWRRLL